MRGAAKVLTLVDTAGGGGGERFACAVATRLDPARFESVLCLTRPSRAADVAAARAAGVRVVELDRRSRASVAPWLRLVRLLRRERIDVLHSHKHGSNVWGALLAGAAGVPVFVAHEHSWSFAGDPLRALLDRRLVGRRADAVLAVSQLDARRLVANGLPAEHVVVQPNGIPRLAPAGADRLRRELGLDRDAPVVGLVGRLRPEKRVDLALEALARLRRRRDDVRLVVVGDGPEEPRLRAHAAALGVDRAVCFLGFRDDAAELAAGFDVAVLCSDREGCPLTLLEYMALGRPVVATRVDAVPEVVDDGAEALLVPPGDADALAAGIERLLADPALASGLGESAARRQAHEFDLDGVVRRIEGLYARLLAGAGRGVAAPAAAFAGGDRGRG